jgi:hypothetical protein
MSGKEETSDEMQDTEAVMVSTTDFERERNISYEEVKKKKLGGSN